jgi:glycosyltransferase involved in cell wall biosynthesis
MPPEPPIRVHALIDTLGIGGAEVLLSEFAAVAATSGIELSVGYLRSVDHAADRLRAADIEPRCIDIPRRLGPGAFRAVRRHLGEVRPALVHTHLGYADLIGGPAARSLSIPTIATVHSVPRPATARDRVKERLMAAARRTTATRIVAVSESVRAGYVASGADRADRVVVVHNGIAASATPGAGPAVRAELGLAADDVVVAMVSSLRPEKAHAVALATVRVLLARFPRLRLVVAGDGPLRAQLAHDAAPFGDRAILAGYRADVMGLLDAVDVLLHPSLHEALPTAILEAMAASVPVVATDVGGIGELVADGVTGALVAPSPDGDALAAVLAPLLEDRALRLRMGAAARSRFEAEFTAARWAARMREIYLSVLDSRG